MMSSSSNPTPHSTPMPHTVWMVWLQGWEAAPAVAHAALASWQNRNPNWTVHRLDQNTLGDHLPQQTLNDIFGNPKPLENIADQIRLELLYRHGGVWADATTLCARPLSTWLMDKMDQDFFTFSSPGPNRMLVNWFLAAKPNSYILAKWRAATCDYWTGRSERHTYFWMHELFATLYETDPQFRTFWDRVPKISARHRFHFGPDARALYSGVPDDILDALKDPPAPVFKLTHKLSATPDAESLFTYLCRYGLTPPEEDA